MKSRVSLPAVILIAAATLAPLARGQSPADAFSLLGSIDDAAARRVWPGFSLSDLPIALFDGTQTLLLRHPNPPPDFAPLEGHAAVLAAKGRHPAVAANSTVDLNGVRTATVVAPPGADREGTMLAYAEEVFHVFWLRRHANFRPDEMARYAYPVKNLENLRRLLAEDEALARGIEAVDARQAAAWAATVLDLRRERGPLLSPEGRAYETGLEMMEGTANYVARALVGLAPGETARRLRQARHAEQLRWRFYDSGAAACLLLDRLEQAAPPSKPDWKTRIDGEPGTTTLMLLEAATARTGVNPARFAPEEWARFETQAKGVIGDLSARQAKVRQELLDRTGARIVVDAPNRAQPFSVTRFDPLNLLVLDGGEVVHPRFLTLSGAAGSIEIANPSFTRGAFTGVVALTQPAGSHPLGTGIRSVTLVGLARAPKLERTDGRVVVEADGVRLSLSGAEARVEGETLRVVLPAGVPLAWTTMAPRPPWPSPHESDFPAIGPAPTSESLFRGRPSR